MNITTVPAQRGIAWFKEGWTLFRQAPLPFTVMGLIALSVEFMGSYNPLLELAVCLLSPLVLAGLFWGAQQADRGERVDIGVIFRGFREKSAPLLKLGTIMLGFLAMIVVVLVLTIAPPMMEVVAQMGRPIGAEGIDPNMTPEEMMVLMSTIPWGGTALTGVLTALLLAVVSTLGMVFAIPLILFHNHGGGSAFVLSIKANMVAGLPISVAGLFWLLLAIPALFTVVGLVVLFPVTLMALYIAQKEIFVSTE